MKLARRSLLVSLAFILSGCATGAGVDSRPLNSGTSRTFEAPFAQVSAAADSTLAGMNITVQGSRMQETSRVINFTKSVSAFSWGEVGKVVITPVDADTTTVFLDSEKRYQVQVTGTNEDEFSSSVFGGIAAALAPQGS